MIIKRYVVDNMNEAMVKIKYELGNEAVIVSQRKIKQNGFLGIIKPKKLEVTAAVDDNRKKNKDFVMARDDMQKEFTELKTMVKDLVNQKITTEPEPKPEPQKRETSKSKYKQQLINNDIPSEIVDEIYEKVKASNGNKRLSSKEFEKEAKAIIEEMIKIDKEYNGRIQVLVGPTGVGKTTTIAKLASSYSLYKNKKVGLITIDTYRIGAVEQLKTYAEILAVPFGTIISVNDIPDVMNKMKDCDIIFVDTTGRNSKNIMQVSETKKFIEELNPDKIHLVMSMTTKNKDIKKIVDNYKILNYDSIILTKIDETDTFGAVLGALYYSNVPISYITNGQNVPADIEDAKVDSLSKIILEADK